MPQQQQQEQQQHKQQQQHWKLLGWWSASTCVVGGFLTGILTLAAELSARVLWPPDNGLEPQLDHTLIATSLWQVNISASWSTIVCCKMTAARLAHQQQQQQQLRLQLRMWVRLWLHATTKLQGSWRGSRCMMSTHDANAACNRHRYKSN